MQKNMKHPKKYGLLFLPILILMLASLNLSTAHATGMAIYWTGAGGDGKWETAANWAFGQVPGVNDLVSISNPVTVSLSSPAQISTLLIQTHAVLNCNAGCSLSSGITNYGTVNNYGFINDVQGGSIENVGGTINNYGTIVSDHTGTNSGAIINNFGGMININGGMTNSGTITNKCGANILGSGNVSGTSINTLKC
ncbi:MAG TPA: hypothetical protein VJZ75_02195 [Candidatus Bathyarchaeia archaeon]|nr:hypothetical protein [Candidatus Bathyarchaeia archaeon]